MPDIQKVSVALTGEQVAALKSAVEGGEYATTSEVVREALREWQWKRELRERETARLRAACEAGIASGPGEPVDWVEFREEAKRRWERRVGEAA